MQAVAPTIGSLAQCIAPIIAARSGDATVFHQRSSLKFSSSLTLPPQGSHLQPLRSMHVACKVPVAPQQHFYLLDEGDKIFAFSRASTSLLSGKLGGLSHSMLLLPKRRRLLPALKASFDPRNHGFLRHKFFDKTKKPKWWLRTLSCIPYLLALHKAWMYAENSYYLYPFLGQLEFLANPYLSAIGRLPVNLIMAYTIIVYLGVVRRKEWPYFFRFHVIMGMLLDMALDIFMILSSWMPLTAYWGKPGMVLWMATTSVYVLTILECIRSALAGMYADISFLSETAYVQTMLQ